ncbi:MAG TPA: hypothetical protein VFZ66_01200 [Herpetosiphonaceae bacterium]
MKRLLSILLTTVIALAAVSPTSASAGTDTTLSVSLWCSRDYVSHYCTAYPSGGTGRYGYEWRWYGPWRTSISGNTILVYPSNCYPGQSYALVVVVSDNIGATASDYTYLAC